MLFMIFMSNVIIHIIITNFETNIFYNTFETNNTINTNMTSIALRKIPEDLHREIKRLQLDLEDVGDKKSLEEIYIELIQKGLDQVKKETPTK